jgi:tetrahydromethanopterin S-methyltransferase subunit A
MDVSSAKDKEVERNLIEKIRSELRDGIGLAKCRRCGCMKEALENLRSSLSLLKGEEFFYLLLNVEDWLQQMEPIKYACLGCEHCFPAVVMNIFAQAFPEAATVQPLGCGFEIGEEVWPPVPGEYFVFCDGPGCPVAVSTLGSVELAEDLARNRPRELCIVGKTETENIGVEKVVKNTITNPTIRFLLLVGRDPEGHRSGGTLHALWENGVDDGMRVIGSPGRRPILRNVTREEVEAFRRQVLVVNLIGCEDIAVIVEKIKELSQSLNTSHSYLRHFRTNSVEISTVPVVRAKEPEKVEMDKAGYFVIIPHPKKKVIMVEHYSYDNRLLRIIEGEDARSIYHTIIENGWVTQLSHAAYLGKELAKAELSLKLGLKYAQDRA